MNNVLLDELPTSWNGYEINSWFQIGVQLFLIQDDKDLSDYEKLILSVDLLFSDDDGNIREHPQDPYELEECIKWFISGWQHDRKSKKDDSKVRLLDFDIDQWRIYADFRQIYGINLNEENLHFWEFMGMLWNMPYEYSSFLHVIDIRQKKPRKGDSVESKKALAEMKATYELDKRDVVYTKEEEKKIDEYDRMMSAVKENKKKVKSNKDKQMVDEFMKYSNVT